MKDAKIRPPANVKEEDKYKKSNKKQNKDKHSK